MSKVSLINGHIDTDIENQSICRSCFHSYVCEQFNENRHITDNQKCHFYNDHFVATADVVEVRHGYWKQTQEPLGWRDVDCVECSVCGESWIMDEDLSLEEHTQGWNYCLNCGAKMDGERRGKE